MEKNLNFSDVKILLSSLRKIILPIEKVLSQLLFFHIKQSKLFFCYLIHYLSKVKDKHFSSSLKISNSLTIEDSDLCVAYEALREVLLLIENVINGSATFSEVTLKDTIHNGVDFEIEHEKVLLQQYTTFLNKDHFTKSTQIDAGQERNAIRGLLCFVELESISKTIPTMIKVFEQCKLEECLNSEECKLLRSMAEDMKDKSSLTLKHAEETIHKVKTALQMESTDLDCLKLFEVVVRTAPFYAFLQAKGLIDREAFIGQYRIVSAQLQHEQYNQAVLHHLYGCFKYISLFFDKKVTFEMLMRKIINLKSIDEGVRHLENVAKNTEQIILWFRKIKVFITIILYNYVCRYIASYSDYCCDYIACTHV